MITKQVAKNFFSLFLSSVVSQLFTLWAFVYIARVFGPEGFGKFSFAQVVALYFLYLADFGLQFLGIRTIAQSKENTGIHVWNITLLRIVFAAASFVLLLFFSWVLPNPIDVKSLIIIFGLSLIPSAVLFEWVFQGKEQMQYVALGRVLKGAVFAALVFFFVHDSDGLNYAAISYVAGISVSAMVLLGVYFKKYRFQYNGIDSIALKTIIITAFPLAAGSFITQIDYNFGTFALGFFLPNEVVGVFSAAYKIVLFLWAFVVVAAANAIFPLIARSYKKSALQFSDSLKKSLKLFAHISIPLGIGGSILAPKIIGFFYPAEYQKAAIVFQISIWTVAIVMYRVVFENALVASQNQRRYLRGYVTAGTVTILGNLLLIPVLGLIAPSIVGIVSELSLLLYFAWSCKFIRLAYILKITFEPLLAGLIMGAMLIIVPSNLFLAIGFGIFLYFGALFFFRYLTVQKIFNFTLL